MGKRLVLVGGGHAHMTVLLRLGEYVRRGHRVTLISKNEYHYYSGMGPGLLGGMYAPRQARFFIRRMAEDRGAEFIRGTVERGTRLPFRRRPCFSGFKPAVRPGQGWPGTATWKVAPQHAPRL